MSPVKFCLFIGILSTTESYKALFPNLPVGEYRIIYERLYPCEPTTNHVLAFNFYFSRKSKNGTEVKGNMTFTEPFDDKFFVELNIASWRLTGGWIDNSYVQKADKLCTNVKKYMGGMWSPSLESFGIQNHDCPIPKGTYISSGLDTDVLNRNDLPKVYFFGKYKFIIKAKFQNNTLAGCTAMEIKLVRPWEMPKY